MFKPSWAALGVAVSCSAVQAADSIEHISVYANRIPTATSAVLASVTVLDREAIVARQAQDLPALLAQLPGVNLARDGGRGQNSGLFVRGGNTGHTLVLIDGVRTGSATVGYKALAMLPLELIERIEVIRGPRTAWFGADALSGVIAITTRQAQGLELNANIGSYGQAGVDISTQQQVAEVSVHATVGYSRADGFNVREDLDPDRDGYEQRFAKVAGSWQSAVGLWRAQLDVNSGRYQFDSAWSSEDQADTLSRSFLVGWQQQLGNWQHQLQLSRVLDEDSAFGPDSRSPFVTERDELSYQSSTTLSEQLTWLVGANWYDESVDRSSVAYVVDRRINRALFTGLNWQQAAWQLESSIRHDATAEYGENTTWQWAAAYHFTDAWQLRLSRGAAFKAPTFNDLYYPGSANPDLAPERTLANEIAINYRGGNGSVQLAWFEQDVDNLIQFDFATYLPQNIEKAEISGIEFVVEARFDELSQSFAYSWIDTQNTLTAQPLVRRPEHTVNWRLTQQWQRWSAYVSADYQSATYQGIYASSEYLGGFTLWGLGSSYAVSPKLTLRAKVDNLFDKTYQTNAGYRTAGINLALSVSYRP